MKRLIAIDGIVTLMGLLVLLAASCCFCNLIAQDQQEALREAFSSPNGLGGVNWRDRNHQILAFDGFALLALMVTLSLTNRQLIRSQPCRSRVLWQYIAPFLLVSMVAAVEYLIDVGLCNAIWGSR